MKGGEDCLKLCKGNAGEILGKRGIDRWLEALKFERLAEGGPMFFGPAFNVGDGGDSSKQAEKNENIL